MCTLTSFRLTMAFPDNPVLCFYFFGGISLMCYGVLTASSDATVKTDVGVFQGTHAEDGDYDMYLGIPYAQVNMSNVFGPAIPQKKFDNIYLADNGSFICPQYNETERIAIGSFDCLRLNVFTPKFTKTKHRHPVLVYIHGNDYETGSNSISLYGPKYIMRYGIILVTINYRLGPYGFLCTETANICNQGLKDQILALKWIRNNIVHFGGDTRKVTIAGTGSGGEMVNLHVLYGREELFQRAIIDSGIFLSNKDEYESPVLDLAESLDFEGDNELDAIEYLNEQSIKSVVTNSFKLKLNYGPRIEKDSDSALKPQRTSIEKIKTMPIYISQSNREIMREYSQKNLEKPEFRDLFYDELEKQFDLDEDELRRMEKQVRHFYIKDESVSAKTKTEIIDFASDFASNYPTKRMIEKYFEDNEDMTLYYSVFSYDGNRNFAKNFYNITMNGATRGDVLGYLFDTSILEEPDDEDQLVIDYMTILWTNFVKYGNPTPMKSNLIPLKWIPMAKGKLNYLEISSTLTNKVRPFKSKMAFWDLMYKLYGNQEIISNRVEPWRSTNV